MGQAEHDFWCRSLWWLWFANWIFACRAQESLLPEGLSNHVMFAYAAAAVGISSDRYLLNTTASATLADCCSDLIKSANTTGQTKNRIFFERIDLCNLIEK